MLLLACYARSAAFITFYQNALHLTKVHCATFYQSALGHKQRKNVIPSSRTPFSRGFRWEILVVMFCSDLSDLRDVKEIVLDFHSSCFSNLSHSFSDGRVLQTVCQHSGDISCQLDNISAPTISTSFDCHDLVKERLMCIVLWPFISKQNVAQHYYLLDTLVVREDQFSTILSVKSEDFNGIGGLEFVSMSLHREAQWPM